METAQATPNQIKDVQSGTKNAKQELRVRDIQLQQQELDLEMKRLQFKEQEQALRFREQEQTFVLGRRDKQLAFMQDSHELYMTVQRDSASALREVNKYMCADLTCQE